MKFGFNHIALIIISLFIFMRSGVVCAQEDRFYTVYKLIDSKKLQQAKKEVDKLINNEATSDHPKAWYYKGIIHYQLFMKEKKAGAREISIKSFQKSIKFDSQNEFTSDCKKYLRNLVNTLNQEAAHAFNNDNFNKAFQLYNKYLKTYRSIHGEDSDIKAYFYKAYAAFKSGKTEEAIKGFKYLIGKDYDDPSVYLYLAELYWKGEQQSKALEVMDRAYKRYPKNIKIENKMLEYYLKAGQLDKLEKEQKKVVNKNPDDIKARLLLASIYGKKGEKDQKNRQNYSDKAKKVYKKILAQDPDNFVANYNLGHLLYIDAVFMLQELSLDADIFEMQKVQDKAAETYKNALKYMQKARQQKPKNKQVMLALSSIYSGLNDQKKSQQFKARANQLDD